MPSRVRGLIFYACSIVALILGYDAAWVVGTLILARIEWLPPPVILTKIESPAEQEGSD